MEVALYHQSPVSKANHKASLFYHLKNPEMAPLFMVIKPSLGLV
jgi:hypothetical protein